MSDKVLVLRTNPPSGSSHGGFVWPESGPVEAPDWNDRAECGGGVDLGDKVKFPRGVVVFCGDRDGALS